MSDTTHPSYAGLFATLSKRKQRFTSGGGVGPTEKNVSLSSVVTLQSNITIHLNTSINCGWKISAQSFQITGAVEEPISSDIW